MSLTRSKFEITFKFQLFLVVSFRMFSSPWNVEYEGQEGRDDDQSGESLVVELERSGDGEVPLDGH